ncbi:hypothetical protein A3Q56_01006 [Intoshia linei]|uniref:Uncharacterized protein n=1 Tax=Intoshia linei TaxID=1819745 RepID=A0A177BCI6_9BILA|nr:hypothetical protein A3Q56_01006 [Intoshia linei]
MEDEKFFQLQSDTDCNIGKVSNIVEMINIHPSKIKRTEKRECKCEPIINFSDTEIKYENDLNYIPSVPKKTNILNGKELGKHFRKYWNFNEINFTDSCTNKILFN